MAELTVAQAATRLHVATSTITRWIKAGHFPNAYKLNPNTERANSPYRIPESDLLAFEQRRRPN